MHRAYEIVAVAMKTPKAMAVAIGTVMLSQKVVAHKGTARRVELQASPPQTAMAAAITVLTAVVARGDCDGGSW